MPYQCEEMIENANMILCFLIGINIMRFSSLRPRWNRRHFADNIFECIFFLENALILIRILLKFIPKSPINNILALV